MKQEITFSQFHDAFKSSDTYKDNFTYEGLRALYDYLEQYEEETGETVEFDMVALCCEYSEYDSAEDAAKEHFTFEGMTYDEDGAELETADEVEEKALKFLEDNTQVIKVGDTGRVIILEF